MRKSIFLALLLALSSACGGATTPETTTPQPVETTASEAPSWDDLTGPRLAEYVREETLAALSSEHDISAENLDGWLQAPSEAEVALPGKAVEKLFDLASVAVASGDYERAESIVALVRAKAQNRNLAYAGNTVLCEARRRSAEDGASALGTTFRELPRSRFGSATVIYQVFQSREQASAQLDQIRHQLVSLDTASTALFFEQILPQIIEHRDQYLSVISEISAEHEAQGAREEYAFSTVDLTGRRGASEVRVAVWDVGTAPELFESQLFTNEGEQPNGVDDDGNGQIDDIHGLASDIGEFTHADLVYSPAQDILDEYTPFLRGIMDLRAGMASSEAAQQVLALFRSASEPAALEAMDQNLSAVGEWAHGTHVAGIMLAGLPQARLAIFRSAWAGEARLYHHRGPTNDELAAERSNVEAIAEYINRHQIRVVNASLGFSHDYVASALRHQSDLYPNEEAVQSRADEVHAHRAATWRMVFEACPQTLFVIAAGNSNRDVIEYNTVPASFEYANVITVGAVDAYGEWATFTNSNPERVRIFDFGVGVPSLVPSGETLPLSGTSMASPNVANLAAKMLSVNPSLTPAQVSSIIEETGDVIEPPFAGRIANEERAIEAAAGQAE